ncbi:flap endonuclease Xni [Thalassotalea sp. LPB0316]|uniref:flap endonuclease Xni n=1 Tax=Thalassotalea sp. LPB0316 TaxID=2769490 RepID=UPI0018673CE2|nr:flap endonuclease Xni [Thalassotalea sp. LPB0316]QOL24534.1 flap endonuclease Xni [Thalassotalea sp. LPB0316]
MSAHVVLIDALNLIRRIYAVQERPFLFNGELAPNTQQQVLHNTVQACSQALSNILGLLKPTHALAVFDSEVPCFRYDIYPDYKKGRAKMPSHLSDKMNDIQDVFLELGVDSLVPEEDEADDVIATLSIKVALRNQDVTIVSTDKAFLMLLNDNIKVFDYFNRRYLDEQYVAEKFSVSPNKLLDLWSLTGDTTNKIPGVEGIGQVTAAQLLDEYGSIAALKNAEQLKPSIKKKLDKCQENLTLSRQLLTLKQDIPLGFNLKDIRLPTRSPS